MRARVFALFLLLVPALHAATFDCTKAISPVEKAICSNPKLSASDSAMAATYRTDLAQLTSASIGLLRADQVQWLAWAQQLCHATDGIMTPADLAVCLQPLYTDRTKALRKAVTRRDGLTFLTRTQYLAAPDTSKLGMQAPNPGFGTLIATWPVADTTDEDWTAWNHAVEQRLLRMTSQVDNAPPPTHWTDTLAEEQDATLTAHLKSIEHDRVTTGLSSEAMTHGGAHPHEEWQTLTFLLNEHRALRADDVFRPDSDWKQAFAEACWKQMSTGDKKTYIYGQVKGPGAKEIQQVILNVSNWTLEHDGLHISYPEYSVTPRYALMDDALIPWPDLKSLLSPRFVLP